MAGDERVACEVRDRRVHMRSDGAAVADDVRQQLRVVTGPGP